MIGDLRELEDGAELDADLCIVGAGAAGIAIAREFLDSDLRGRRCWRAAGCAQRPVTESLNEGEASGIDPASLTDGRGRLLGGATALWAGQCLPPDPRRSSSATWVPHSGWPLDRGRARALPSPRRGALSDRRRGLRRAGVGRIRRRAARGRSRARWCTRFSVWCPEPHLGRLYRTRLLRSRQRAGAAQCHRHRGGHHARRGPVSSALRVADARRARTARDRARACVLCGGGIENARLLLASDSVHRGGVGNAGDLVGPLLPGPPQRPRGRHSRGRRAAPAGAVRPALPAGGSVTSRAWSSARRPSAPRRSSRAPPTRCSSSARTRA